MLHLPFSNKMSRFLNRPAFQSGLLLLIAVGCAQAAAAQDSVPLVVNQSQEKNLSGAAPQTYSIKANSGQFLQFVIEQKGTDVAAKLFSPDGKLLAEINNVSAIGEKEEISAIAETTGMHRVEIRLADEKAKPGAYVVRLEALREPTAKDRSLIAAQKTTAEADALFDQKDLPTRRKAIPKYEEAYKHWLDTGNQSEAAATLIQLATLHTQLNDPKQSVEALTKAIPLLRETKERQREAATLNTIGTNYLSLGEPRKAIEQLNQSLSLRRALKDKRGEAITINALGESYRRLGEKRKALKLFEQSLALRREVKDRNGEAVTLNSLGVVYSDLGEIQKALDTYSQALPLRRANNDKPGEAITLNNIGRAYDVLGLPLEALKNYEQTLPIARAANARRTEAETLNFMGLAYWAAEDYPRAIDRFEQTLLISREIKNPILEAAVYNNLGLVYNSMQDWRKATESLNRALPLLRQIGDRLNEARVLNNLGFAYEGLGEKDEAIKAHNQALQLATEVRDAQREAKIRYGIARIESSRNRLKPAREQLEKTVKIVESLRSKLASPDLRADYRASVQKYYDLYIDVLMRLGKRLPKSGLTSTALQVSEQARARSLIELLTEANADIRQGVDLQLVERERELQDQLNEKTTEQIRLLGSRAKADQIGAVGKELEQLSRDLRDTQAQIRSSSPRYANLTQPQPLAARQIQGLLDANTMLLEFSLGEERSYLWAVTPTAVRSYTLPKRAVIEASAKRFYELITARNQFQARESNQQKQNRIADADAESPVLAAELGRMLLAQVAPLLGKKRLIVVTDGALQYVPFSALSVTSTKAPYQPLVASHEILSLPSATTLAVLRGEAANHPKATKTVAVIADPVFEAKDERIKVVKIGADGNAAKPAQTAPQNPAAAETDPSRILLYKSGKDSGAVDAEFRIPRLPNTRREAETILSLAPDNAGKSAFDFAADRAAATSEDLGQYRILHFATHGFLNSLNPELSGLVLSLVDEQGKPQNGYLLAPEIYNLKLPATELVVLSACQTGLGKEVRGEGIVGLTRGFMYAGAPRVVVSLWSVNDRSTADLMKSFYEAMLAKGQRPAAALRSAQLELMRLKVWKSPYFWAAFGLQGEWR